MKLFVDTGSVKEIEQLASIGILDGVTTNPSLLAKEGGDYRQTLKQICQIVKGPVSAEVVATDFQGMLREGRDLASIDEHIVIKVPLTKDGVKACKALSGEGRRVNVTLIFSATQAWFAAKAGAARRHRFDRFQRRGIGEDQARRQRRCVCPRPDRTLRNGGRETHGRIVHHRRGKRSGADENVEAHGR